MVALDGSEALLAHVQMDESAHSRGVTVRVPGLDPDVIRFLLARIGDGTYHAVRSVCPHQGVDLAEGVLVGRNLPGGDVGRHDHVADATVIRCPRHGYAYDVRDGCSRFDERSRIKAYKVTIEDGRVLVRI